MCKEMPVIPVNKNNRKKWRAKTEERHKGFADPPPQKKKSSVICKARRKLARLSKIFKMFPLLKLPSIDRAFQEQSFALRAGLRNPHLVSHVAMLPRHRSGGD
jgi:hypothetical protein